MCKKHSSSTLQTGEFPLTWIALLSAYSPIALLSWGHVFFMFYFICFAASTVLFVVILHHVLKCSVRMQAVDYSRQNHWLLYSFLCMHSKVSFIPDNRLVSVATGKWDIWPPLSLSELQHTDAGHFMCCGALIWRSAQLRPGLRFRGLRLKCLAQLGWAGGLRLGLQGWAQG